MKTQIVNIDPHDDYDSVREKLQWAKADRIILVWPGRAEIFSNRLDIVLLKRLGQQRGVALGLLTFDPQVRAHAAELSIPVFEDLENISEASWQTWQASSYEAPLRDSPHELTRPAAHSSAFRVPAHPLVRLLLLLLPISFFLFALIALVPSAEITVTPVTLRELETLSFSLGQNPTSDVLVLPYEVRELEQQGENRIPTSGRSATPSNSAQGEIIFTNRVNETITIPVGTSVRSSDFPSIYFQTVQTVQLEAGEGEQVSVNVVAAQAGPEGNLRESAIDSIDGPLGLNVSVTNPLAISGGSLQSRAAVSATDIEEIQRLLEDELKAAFLVELEDSLLPHERALVNTLQIAEVIEENFDATIDEAVDSLGLELRLLITISVVDLREVERLARSRLQTSLAPGYTYVGGSPEVIALRETTDVHQGSILEADFSVRSYLEVDIQRIKAIVRGKSPEELAGILKERYSDNLTTATSISPSWWPRMPLFEHQISVNLQPEGS